MPNKRFQTKDGNPINVNDVIVWRYGDNPSRTGIVRALCLKGVKPSDAYPDIADSPNSRVKFGNGVHGASRCDRLIVEVVSTNKRTGKPNKSKWFSPLVSTVITIEIDKQNESN